MTFKYFLYCWLERLCQMNLQCQPSVPKLAEKLSNQMMQGYCFSNQFLQNCNLLLKFIRIIKKHV